MNKDPNHIPSFLLRALLFQSALNRPHNKRLDAIKMKTTEPETDATTCSRLP